MQFYVAYLHKERDYFVEHISSYLSTFRGTTGWSLTLQRQIHALCPPKVSQSNKVESPINAIPRILNYAQMHLGYRI